MKIENNVINLTDYSFQKLCDEKYGINRGVYNTIDRWFYDKGIKNIVKRRKEILNFLSFMLYSFDSNHKSKIKFGSRGLTNKLNEFSEQEIIGSKQTYENRTLA